MKRLVVAIVCFVGLVAGGSAQAAPILVTTTDTVFGTVVLDFVASTQTITITGLAPADIVDGVVVNSGGLDADAAPAPGLVDAFFFDLVDEALFFAFDESTAAGIGTPVFSLLAGGSGLTPITDPALAAFVAPNNLALFSLFGEPVIITDPESGTPISLTFTYSLDSIAAPTQVEAIPEPATIGLVGMGILAAARARRARRKQDVA